MQPTLARCLGRLTIWSLAKILVTRASAADGGVRHSHLTVKHSCTDNHVIMKQFVTRPGNQAEDKEEILALLLRYRKVAGIHVYPTVWRFRLLLSSRVWKPTQDTQLWQDAHGHVIAFAMLWSRHSTSHYLVLEQFIDPAKASMRLLDEILMWSIQRTKAIGNESQKTLMLYTNQLVSKICSDNQLERHGFSLVKPDLQEHNLYFSRKLQNSNPPFPALPKDYTVRSLENANEIDAYQGLYEFAAVNPEHRKEMFSSDEYGHQVIADLTGRFVAYCEYSICRAEWQQGIERIGWIDYIGTRSENRQKGLGHAVLLASLHRLHDMGAEIAMLVTVNTNYPAIKLYAKTGFTQIAVLEPSRYEMKVRPTINMPNIGSS
ncbi:MAG: GNAT family N-acetyltransferase [Chloroflexota bacterium]